MNSESLVQPISAGLPDPSVLDTRFAAVLDSFSTLSTKAQGFSLADLGSVLDAGQSLPIPDSLNLVEGALNSLGQMARIIPSDPEELTTALRAGLEQLVTDLTDVNKLLEPMSTLVDWMTPVLNRFTFLNDTVTRINSIIADLPAQASGLNLGNLPEQFEYFSNVLGMYPEAANVSPFKELKAQIDTLKVWLSSSPADLSASFCDQIQMLAEALPTQLDDIMEMGLDAVAAIETPFSALDRAVWYDPYVAALNVAAAMNLDDLSQIDDYLASLNEQVTIVTGVTTSLAQKTKQVLDRVNDFDANLFSQDLRNAFSNILNTISPEKPGIMAAAFHQIRKMMSGFQVGAVTAVVEQIDQEVEKQVGDLDVSTITETIEETAGRMANTVQAIDQALVKVATTLSSLVSELQTLIADVDLADLLNQIQTAFIQLTTMANALLTQVENISTELTTFVDEVGQDIDNLDISALTGEIGDLLSDIVSVLGAPEVQNILGEAKKGIDEIVQNLEGVTLKPVFDRVIEETDDLKGKLARVDVSELNDLLKVALKTALDIIRSINFASQVADKLRGELQTILDESTNLIDPLCEKYEEIVGQINRFDPGMMVSEQLVTPFEELAGVLNKIDPVSLLSPLQGLQESLLGALETLSPTALLAPLDELHTQLVNALRSLSPHDLIAPLNDLLDQVTGLLDELGVEAFLAEISSSVNQINTLISNFVLGDQIKDTSFWETLAQVQVRGSDLTLLIESQLDQFLDQIMAPIPDVDMSILQPALDGLRSSIATVKGHINTPQVLARIDDVVTTLNAQRFDEGVTALTQSWRAQKARFDAITPPPEWATKYETLKEHLSDLSPIVLLSGPATLVGRISVDLETAQAELNQGKESLVALLTESQDRLDALLPGESTASSFRALLRETLDDQIIQPIRQLFPVLETRLQEFSGVIERIRGIALRFRAPYEMLTVIPNNIDRIKDALIDAETKITAINLSFLENELQDVLDEAITQLDAVKPSDILSSLETSYQDALKALRALYPEAAIQSLGATYQNVVVKNIQALHPDKTVAEPLNAAYQNVLKLQKDLNVDKVFDALNGKLESIRQELEDGLDRSGNAFNELLAALPL
jgi:hypothetical protein